MVRALSFLLRDFGFPSRTREPRGVSESCPEPEVGLAGNPDRGQSAAVKQAEDKALRGAAGCPSLRRTGL